MAGDNTHPLDNPNVLTDEITTRNGSATTPDTRDRLPTAQVSKIAVGGDGVADDVTQTGKRLPVDPAAEGTWSYLAGIAATEVIAGRVVSVACLAGGSGGTVTINGGASIPIPADTAWEMDVKGRLIDPTIVFAGTVTYTVQRVA